jgi:hypothetical protein
MLAARDAVATATEGPPPTSSDAKALLAADAAAVKATDDPAKPEERTERTKPTAKELGEAASPGPEYTEGAAGEVAAAAADPGAMQTGDPGAARTGDSGLDRAGRREAPESTAR